MFISVVRVCENSLGCLFTLRRSLNGILYYLQVKTQRLICLPVLIDVNMYTCTVVETSVSKSNVLVFYWEIIQYLSNPV